MIQISNKSKTKISKTKKPKTKKSKTKKLSKKKTKKLSKKKTALHAVGISRREITKKLTRKSKFGVKTYQLNMSSPLNRSVGSPHLNSPRKSFYMKSPIPDSILKEMTDICHDVDDHNIDHIIDRYMEKGWNELTMLYKTGNSNIVLDQETMNFLNLYRKLLFKIFFKCKALKNGELKTSKNYYGAYGSDSVISDYDVNIIGPDAPEFTLTIYKNFKDKFSDVSSLIDSNFYCQSIYLDIKENNGSYISNVLSKKLNNFKIQTYDLSMYDKDTQKVKNQCFTLSLNNNCSTNLLLDELHFVLIKYYTFENILLEMKNNKNINNVVNLLLNQITVSKGTYLTLFEEREKMDEYDSYIKNVDYSRKLYDLFYKNNPIIPIDLLNYMHMSKFYSVESYYSHGTFNVVVLSQQAKEFMGSDSGSILPTEYDYLFSAIENLGDLCLHINDEPEENKQNTRMFEIKLRKCSKYFKRIIDSLDGLYNNSDKKILDLKQYEILTNIVKKKNNKIEGDADILTSQEKVILLYNPSKSQSANISKDYTKVVLEYFLKLAEPKLNEMSSKMAIGSFFGGLFS